MLAFVCIKLMNFRLTGERKISQWSCKAIIYFLRFEI